MKSLWQEVSRLPIKITHTRPPMIQLQREKDEYIMEVVLSLAKYNTTQVKAINNVRIYFQCMTLADILSGDNRHIQHRVTNRSLPTIRSCYQWPASHPCKADFDLWDTVLTAILSYVQSSHSNLGKWLPTTHTSPQCYVNIEEDQLYIQEEHSYSVYVPEDRRHTRSLPRYIAAGMIDNLPPDYKRGTCHHISEDTIQFEGSSHIIPLPNNCYTNLQDIFDEWGETWIWNHLRINDNGIWLASALQNGTAILVCDGSYQPHLATTLGTAAWKIECTETQESAMAVLPSPTNIANAYRSELTGIYASLAMILAVTTLHNVESGSLLAGCDNEQGLYLSSLINDRVSPKQKHSDILRTIRNVRGKLSIDITFKHISGHQDDTILYEHLDRPSQLNIDCDLLAKAGLRRFHKEKLIPPDALPHE